MNTYISIKNSREGAKCVCENDKRTSLFGPLAIPVLLARTSIRHWSGNSLTDEGEIFLDSFSEFQSVFCKHANIAGYKFCDKTLHWSAVGDLVTSHSAGARFLQSEFTQMHIKVNPYAFNYQIIRYNQLIFNCSICFLQNMF